jgi:GAF domain-containing protein
MTPDLTHALSLAAGEEAPARVFAYAAEGIRRDAGSLLTTATVYDMDRMLSRRVYTEDAAAYPIGNFKRIERDGYYETLLVGLRPFHNPDLQALQRTFFDWEKIRDLGFESGLNVPAVADGTVIGTANLLHRSGHFTEDRIAAALAWQPVLTLAFLLLHRRGAESASFHEGAPPAPPGEIEG